MVGTISHQPVDLGLLLNLEEEWNSRSQRKNCRSRRRSRTLLWQKYFEDPSQWWDNRSRKSGPSYPDFKHKVTKDILWIDGWGNPSWVMEELRTRGLAPDDNNNDDDASAFTSLLRACAKNKDLNWGTRLHNTLVEKGLLEECLDALVTMYAKCGALAKAKELLDSHRSRNVLCWTALIAGYARQGQGQDALNCFEEMQRRGVSPTAVIFACALKACGSLQAFEKGKQIHDEIARQELLQDDTILCTALLDMYAKCGALAKARKVLEELPTRDVVSWNALIREYAQQGEAEEAMKCFKQMQHEGLTPDAVTFSCALKACGTLRAINKGGEIHDEVAKRGLLCTNAVVGNALVDMYAKCGALTKARAVLEELPSRDVISWTALIGGYVQQGHGEQALSCYKQMRRDGLSPDAWTFSCVLKACGSIQAVDVGEDIHEEIARQGLLGKNMFLGNALLDMYVGCGALAKAQRLLMELPSRDVVSWNTLIGGYAQQGQGEQALKCFREMKEEGLSPSVVTFTCLLKACGSIGADDIGESIHKEIAKQGLLGSNIVLASALVDMYAKCGSLSKAQQVLEKLPSRDVVCWSTLITGYGQQGHDKEVLELFEKMQDEGISPDAVAFACILRSCGRVGAPDVGERVHDDITSQGMLEKNTMLSTSLVAMYAKCGAFAKAKRVLEEMSSRSVIAWTALIEGYAQHGHGKEALECFERMRREGLTPDIVTFVCALKACGCVRALDKGEQIHEEISKLGFLRDDPILGNALMDMYAKCRALEKARKVLEEMPTQDVVSWTTLIGGYAQQGRAEQALSCFKQMQRMGLVPDAWTYACVLNACSQKGLVEDGYDHFMEMSTRYGLKPNVEHYTCMIDLFGRTGQLDKVVAVIWEMPPGDDAAIWSALLGACCKWEEVDVGRWVFEQAIEADKTNSAAYVLMANLYKSTGMLEDARNIEVMRTEMEEARVPEPLESPHQNVSAKY